MQRFDVVVCVLSGDDRKPRPALVIQNNVFNEVYGSVVICPFTSHVEKEIIYRPTLLPDTQNGLEQISQIMVDKITTIKKDKIGKILGKISLHKQEEVIRALKLWLDLE